MDSIPTLILPPRYTSDSISLAGAAARLSWHVERLASWRAPEWMSGIEEPVFYGEPLFAAVVADQLGLALLEPPFNWLTRLPSGYVKRNVSFAAFAEARMLNSPAFIKPTDDKCFPARVYDSGSQLPHPDLLQPSTPVLISEPVTWELEFRCFVRDRKVCTLSPYLRNGKLVETPEGVWPASDSEFAEAESFAATVLADASVVLPLGVVVDVGILSGRGWAVIEANSAWGSGLYGCDREAVLGVLRGTCIRKDRVMPEHREWILDRS